MYSRKRARTEQSSQRKGLSKRRIAQLINIQNAKQFPYKVYGAAHFKRGSQFTRDNFGETWRKANQLQRENRQIAGYTGRGLYKGRGAYWGKAAGQWLGNMAGSPYGLGAAAGQIGGYLGDKASDWIESKFKGRGMYTTNSNSLIQGGTDITNMKGDKATYIERCEYIGDINGAQSFTNNNFLINPANQILFPWLSQIACNYDEYEFVQLIFEFRSVTAILSTTSAQVGTIIMGCNYNSCAPNFQTKQQMMEYDTSKSVQINENLLFGIECDPSKNALSPILYTTTATSVTALANASDNQDPKTYFLGNLQIAVNACQSGQSGEIGELWVTYKVKLRKPKQFVSLGYNIPYVEAFFQNTTTSFVGTTITNAINSVLPIQLQVLSTTGTAISGTSGVSYVLTNIPTACTQLTQGSIFGGGSQILYQLPSNLAAGTYRLYYLNSGVGTTNITGLTPTCTSNINVVVYGNSSSSTSSTQINIIFQINTSGINGGVVNPQTVSLIGFTAQNPVALNTPTTCVLLVEQVNPATTY